MHPTPGTQDRQDQRGPRGGQPVASSGIDTKAEGDIIAATIFKNTKYGGGSMTITNTALCESDDGVDLQIDLDESWKNKVSSIQPWGRCTLNLFSEPGLGGERDGPFENGDPEHRRRHGQPRPVHQLQLRRSARRTDPGNTRLTPTLVGGTMTRRKKLSMLVIAITTAGATALFPATAQAEEEQPTTRELLEQCNDGTDVCVFHPSAYRPRLDGRGTPGR